MLSDYEVVATIPASNLERAKNFYSEKLGFRIVEDTPAGVLYQSKNSHFFLYPTQFAGTAQNTAVAWEVEQIEKVVKDLRSRGVKFEEYNMAELKTVDGIATMGPSKVAWFKDTEGNTLGITQMSR